MPEFIMPSEGRVQIVNAPFMGATRTFDSLDSFTQGYIEAMYFTETGTADDGDMQDATFGDLAPETLQAIVDDCAEFQRVNAVLLEGGSHDDEQAGRDLWFTRNAHGVGFWDRDEGTYTDAEALTDACGWHTAFPEVDLYRGDDGLLYLAEG